MAENEPLLFRTALGTLRPLTQASEDALAKIGTGQTVRVEIKRTTGNTRRMAFYWVMLKIALENMDDAFEGQMSVKALHRWLKRKAGLAKPITSKKTGEVIDYDYDSISFAEMPENDRAEFIDFAATLLGRALGVEPHELMNEARAA